MQVIHGQDNPFGIVPRLLHLDQLITHQVLRAVHMLEDLAQKGFHLFPVIAIDLYFVVHA